MNATKTDIRRCNSVDVKRGDGTGLLDRWVGWREDGAIHVQLHSTYGTGRTSTWSFKDGETKNGDGKLSADFEEMYRTGEKIRNAPENSMVIDHYRWQRQRG